jgi:hypothetical protein
MIKLKSRKLRKISTSYNCISSRINILTISPSMLPLVDKGGCVARKKHNYSMSIVYKRVRYGCCGSTRQYYSFDAYKLT